MRSVKLYLPLLAMAVLATAAAVAVHTQKDEMSDCERAGGKWMPAGLEGVATGDMICVRPFPDGGKPCASSTECAGSCVVTDYSGAGHCKEDDNLFGCYVTIEEYRETSMILCRD